MARQIDDGTREDSISLTSGGYIAWLNHLAIEPGGEVIRGISLTWGNVSSGTPATVYLWDDPNRDGDPTDAVVLASAATSVENPETDVLTTGEIPPTPVGPAGTSFFAGAIMHDAWGEYPAPLNNTVPRGESWLAGSPGSLVDPNNLRAAEYPVGKVGSYGFPSNCLVRAEGTRGLAANDCNQYSRPDDCGLAGSTSEDLDINGLLDECEDYNHNGIRGDCELDCGPPGGDALRQPRRSAEVMAHGQARLSYLR